MHIPFVIDNQQHTMSAILTQLLAQHKGQALDVATAYFNVGGWQLLQPQLERVSSLITSSISTTKSTSSRMGIAVSSPPPV